VAYFVGNLVWGANDQGEDQAVIAAELGWVLGFLIGVGAFVAPLNWMLGRDMTHEDEMFLAGKDQGVGRYFRFTTDHKVVGVQLPRPRHDDVRRRWTARDDDPHRVGGNPARSSSAARSTTRSWVSTAS